MLVDYQDYHQETRYDHNAHKNVLPPALWLTVTDAAKQLGVTRAALSRVLNERSVISPEMALRLEG